MAITLTENVWADGNRERLDIKMDIPNLGYGDIIEYLDFDNQVLSVFIPSINVCTKYKIPYQMNIKEVFMKIADPSSGILDYLGEKTLDYAPGETFYAFHMNMQDVAVEKADQTLFFNSETKQLEYAEMNKLGFLMYSEKGPQPAEFTAADFTEPAVCNGVPVNPDFPTMGEMLQ